MIINPMIPIWLMAIISIALLLIKRKGILPYIRQMVLVLLLFAVNLRPMILDDNGEVIRQKSNLQVVFVVDKTISMLANDYDGNKERLTGAKKDMKELTDRLMGANYCVVGFHNDAQVLTPFSDDVDHIKATIDAIYPIDISYAEGTNVGVARDMVLNIVKKRSEKGPVVVFYVGDGENTSSTQIPDFSNIAEYIKGGAVLGYGTEKGGTMELKTGYDFDQVEQIMDESDWPYVPAVSRMDAKNLENIASQMGVPFIHMGEKSSLDEVIENTAALATMESPVKENDPVKSATDIYYWLVVPIALMLGFEYVLLLVKRNSFV